MIIIYRLSQQMNRLNFLPTPPLPFTGSFESEPDGGWRKMKGAAKWMVFKGGKLYNWFIARPDCHGMKKADIVEKKRKRDFSNHTEQK